MSKLYVINASAGSGKTFRLTVQYLSYLFIDRDQFRHTLAVTFTNKATEEMKSRIVRVLYDLANGGGDVYALHISKLTGLTREQLQTRAGVLLKMILHHYCWFSVQTIDRFFLTVIRAFTREIGLNGPYEVELHIKKVLSAAVDNLFMQLHERPDLRQWLTQFALQQISESKSWRLKEGLLSLGEQLFREDFKLHGDSVMQKFRDKEFLKGYRIELNAIVYKYKVEMKRLGEEAMGTMTDRGVSIDMVFQKNKGPAGYLSKLASGRVEPPNSYVMEVYNGQKEWTTPKSDQDRSVNSICIQFLKPHLDRALDYFQQHATAYNSALIILNHSYTLGVLADIAEAVYNHTRDKNLFLISDSADFIHRIIRNNDTPFIYEKVGNYYHHYLIDEFQDTSALQWQNFKPLISNSLSGYMSNLVVGDVKQSIYRWRNSNWEVLSSQVYNDFYAEAIQRESLCENRRSAATIVHFNNSLFPLLAGVAGDQTPSGQGQGVQQNSRARLVYNDVEQKVPEGGGQAGYVKLAFIDKDEDAEVRVFSLVREAIESLQEKGCPPGKIAILVRKREEAVRITSYLLALGHKADEKYNYGVISDETLLISSSRSVGFIIAVLRYIANPADLINLYYLHFEYLNHILNGQASMSNSLIPHLSKVPAIKSELPVALTEGLDALQGLPLAEVVRQVIALFGIGSLAGEGLFLYGFKDLVNEYIRGHGADISGFIQYWDDSGKDESISGADGQDAIRVMTIHKAKGLEFNTVIVPFCDWEIDPPHHILWCRPDRAPFNGLNLVPVPYGIKMIETIFAKEYTDERERLVVDNINLLYVAFTRAREALYAFVRHNVKPDNDTKTIAGLLWQALLLPVEQTGLKGFNPEKRIFETGVVTVPHGEEIASTEEQLSVDVLHNNATLKRIAVACRHLTPSLEGYSGGCAEGLLLHSLLANIVTTADIEKSLHQAILNGMVEASRYVSLKEWLVEKLSHPEVHDWFSGKFKVLTEPEIADSQGGARRPDRIMLDGHAVIIVDFKFGTNQLPIHLLQVKEYMSLLARMGYQSIHGFIWYVMAGRVERVR